MVLSNILQYIILQVPRNYRKELFVAFMKFIPLFDYDQNYKF